MEAEEKSKLVCPKCKSNQLNIHEVWRGHTIFFEQINGLIERDNGSLNEGNPYKLEASCRDCEHRWSVRKGFQIDDILK